MPNTIYNPVEVALIHCLGLSLQPYVDKIVAKKLDDRMELLLDGKLTQMLEGLDLTSITVTKKEKKAKEVKPAVTTTEPVESEVQTNVEFDAEAFLGSDTTGDSVNELEDL
jgi:hypothetical protein